jgi:hypothetical protein
MPRARVDFDDELQELLGCHAKLEVFDVSQDPSMRRRHCNGCFFDVDRIPTRYDSRKHMDHRCLKIS